MRYVAPKIVCLVLISVMRPIVVSGAEQPPTVLWNTTVGSGDDYTSAWAVAAGRDGHPVVTGASCPSFLVDCSFRTVKLDSATGNILWDVTFHSGSGNIDQAAGVAVGRNGHPVVVGDSCTAGFASCVLRIIKYHKKSGAVLWTVTFSSGDGLDGAGGIAIGPDGNLVVSGTTCAASGCKFLTVKFDRHTGAVLWAAVFSSGKGFDAGGTVDVGPDGHPVVTGQSCDAQLQSCDFRTIKYDGASGTIIWNVTFDSGGNDDGFQVSIGDDGNPVAVGTTCAAATSASSNCAFRTIKYDGSTGAILWNETFNSQGDTDDIGFGVKVGDDGHPVVTGTACPRWVGTCMFSTLRLDATTGAVLWHVTLGDLVRYQTAHGITIGVDGNPVVAGTSSNGSVSSAKVRVSKYGEQTLAGCNSIDKPRGKHDPCHKTDKPR